MRLLACCFLLSLLCGCRPEDVLSKFSTPAEQAVAKDYLSQIHAHQFTAIEKDIDPSLNLNTADLEALLEKMADMTPAGEPTSITIVGARRFEGPGVTEVNTTFEYTFGDKLFVENLATREKGGTRTIIGLHVYPEAESLKEQNRFTLSGKGARHYAMLVLATAVVATILYALVACIRTKGLRRKWLWVIFIIFGFGKASLNWTSGEWAFQLLNIQLFGAGASAQFYSPWIIAISLPVGAIVFLLRRRRSGNPYGSL